MSKLQQKIQAARRKGVYVFKLPAHLNKVRKAVENETFGRMTTREVIVNQKEWAVYVEGEWCPRIGLTKREAVNLAYEISVSKNVEITVTFGYRELPNG